MRKIVFFDIDGTILNSRNEIPKRTKESIERLRKKGIYVAIATGRAPFMFETIRKELQIDTYVSLNGQYVVLNNEPIYQFQIHPGLAEKLVEKSKEQNHHLIFMSHDSMKANTKDSRYIQKALSSINIPYPEVDEEFYKKQAIHQFLLFCKEGEEKSYQQAFPMFKFLRWHEYACDVIPKDGSKAEGIKKIIAKLNVEIDATYAFGDGYNDVEMLRTVGKGIAMGNAPLDVKEKADFVTKHVDDDGIYYGLKVLELL